MGAAGAPMPAAAAPMPAAAPAPAGGLPIDPVWLRGETPLHVLHADGLYLGPTPVAKLIAALVGFMIRITGGHIKISLVVTAQRVLMLTSTQAYCGWTKSKLVQSLALGSIQETGWAQTNTYWCLKTRALSIKTKTQTHGIVVKKLSDAQLRDFANQVSAVVVANVQSGTAT